MIEALTVWLPRIVALIPSIEDLWTATKESDQKAQLEAQLALVRAIESRLVKEDAG